MHVLGIETSCDETAAAVIRRNSDGGGVICSNIVFSQLREHAPYGGVVPEIAARAHVEVLDGVVMQALAEADLSLRDLDAVAATAGPGLLGGVMIGLVTAKALASAAKKPLIAVNHLEGHALTARLTDAIAFPYLLLLVSGGHTQLVAVRDVGCYERWGSTIDDALGEAFDKTAKLLGLGYPGGPRVEEAARVGRIDRFDLPRPLRGRVGCDFSFSGLKTALRLEAERLAPVDAADIADLCAGFQAAVADCLCDRLRGALSRFAEETRPTLVVAGGVAANQALRSSLETLCREMETRLVIPPPALCTDNGAMIAWAGAERLALGLTDGLDVSARARWPLDETAEPVLGSGKSGAKV